MVASEAAGRARFSALASILPRRHQGGSRQTEAQMKNPLYHLGALYDQTQTFFGVTRDTMARPAAAMEVVSWTHSFADQFVRSEDLHPRFRDLLQRREHEDYPWLATQYPSFAQVLHPFFTTSAIFQGFTGETHVDAADCYPSILLNFGAMAHLELPDFGVAVELQPFDIVVFDSGRVRHRTTRSPIDIAAGISETQRWAVSLFHRHRATLRQPTPARANDISRILTAPIQAGASEVSGTALSTQTANSPNKPRDTDTAADTDHTNTSSTSRRKRRRPD
ncbi:hypothetical protein BCV70DRAFT_219269 [Testicularia cyperi]|uniref:Uncharacterized protein n=1 Tax=Testicularia cyperi TaxID=1882483 RepID=A0A317XHG2_9BASI|nr:hypothetical protein BCV70DRAFT_219269 [Testicularia cyperi]